MIDLTPLETQSFDMATIFIREAQPIHLDPSSVVKVLDEEVHITRDNVLIQTSKDDPGKNAHVLEVVKRSEITSFILIKYNLIETVPHGLVVTKRAEA